MHSFVQSRDSNLDEACSIRVYIAFVRMKRLIQPKIYFSLGFLACGCIMPFLSMYYRSLGIGSTEIGVLTAVLPITTFLMAPTWTYLADRYESHKLILAFTSLTSAIVALMFPQLMKYRDQDLLFPLGICLVIAFAVFFSPFISMLDAVVLSILKTTNSKLDNQTLYGRQRVFASVSYAFAGVLVSALLRSLNNSDDGFLHRKKIGLSAIFYAYSCIMLLFAVYLLVPEIHRLVKGKTKKERLLEEEVIDLNVVKQADIGSKEVVPETLTVLESIRTLIASSEQTGYLPYFWAFVFVQGLNLSIINNFCFLMLTEHLNAPASLFGFSSLSRAMLEIPFFYWSGSISKVLLKWLVPSTSDTPTDNERIIGYRYMLILSMSIMTFRTLLYALMMALKLSPWIDVFIEVLHGMIFATFHSSAVQISASAPSHLQATSQGLMSAFLTGFGSSVGGLFGGFLYGYYGPVALFAITSAISFCTVLLYAADARRCSKSTFQALPQSNDQN